MIFYKKVLHMHVVFHLCAFLDELLMLSVVWIASYILASGTGRVFHLCGFFCVLKDPSDEKISFHILANGIGMAFGLQLVKLDGLIDLECPLYLVI
jgi:hypothetical protein